MARRKTLLVEVRVDDDELRTWEHVGRSLDLLLALDIELRENSDTHRKMAAGSAAMDSWPAQRRSIKSVMMTVLPDPVGDDSTMA